MLHALCSQSPYYRPDGSRQPLVGLRTRHGFCGVCGLRAVVEQRHHILLATARGGANALLFGIYSPKSMTKALCAQGTSTQPLYTHWAQLSWVRWACVPRRVSAACPDALRACPTMAPWHWEQRLPCLFPPSSRALKCLTQRARSHLSPSRVGPMQMRMLPPHGSSLQLSPCLLSLLQRQIWCRASMRCIFFLCSSFSQMSHPSKQSSSQVHLFVAEASTMSRRLWSAEVPGV